MPPTPPTTPADGAFEYLLTQGVLGVMCVLLIGALVWAVKALLKAKDDRLSDQKMYADALNAMNTALKELTVEMNRSASEMVNDVTRASDAMTNGMDSLEKAVKDDLESVDKGVAGLTASINNLTTEQVRLGAALGGKK